jgi:hypothetical protein
MGNEMGNGEGWLNLCAWGFGLHLGPSGIVPASPTVPDFPLAPRGVGRMVGLSRKRPSLSMAKHFHQRQRRGPFERPPVVRMALCFALFVLLVLSALYLLLSVGDRISSQSIFTL